MTFLVELSVYLAAALAVVPIAKRLGLSSIIGYLTAGVIIGPSGLGLVAHASETLHFAEIGVVLLLFVIGLELHPKRLWVMRRNVFGLGSAQVAAVSLALSAVLWTAFALPPVSAVVLGFALALSSTAFVLQFLAEERTIGQAHGRAAFGVLLLQDIAVIPAIVVIAALGGGSPEQPLSALTLGVVVFVVIAARFVLKPILRYVATTGIQELFIAASLAIVCGAALLMQAAGLSMGLGAFVAGMLVADSEYRHQLETDVTPFKGLLLGLFFIAVGMSANISLMLLSPGLVVGLTAALIAIKAITFYGVLRIFRHDHATSLRTTTVLSQGGEFAFVLLTMAVTSSVIAASVAELAILVVTVSMATTPILMKGLERVLRRAEPERPFDEVAGPVQPVIIAGFGRFGQIVGRILSAQQHPFTAMDVDPGQVDFVREFGNEVYYGDATRLDLLTNAGAKHAEALVIAVDDVEASVQIARIMHETFPHVALFARARNRRHEIALRNVGVDYVVRETLLSSLDLTSNLLQAIGLDPTVVATFKTHDCNTLAKQASVAHDPSAFKQTTVEATQELKALFANDQAARES